MNHSESCDYKYSILLLAPRSIWVCSNGGIFQSNLTLTWNESRKYCEDIGKVLFDAKKNESMASLMKSLKDTNQAWVSARVEIIHFVKEPVCMATSKQFAPKESFDKDIIGNCFKFCNGYLYAGLKERDCYCFKDSTNLTRSTSCNSTCDNDPFHKCGGNESISLYEKVDKSITERIVHGCKACVYARATNGLLRLLTESCVGHMADGALCESVKYTACRHYNWTVASNQLCRMDLANSLRWKKAKQYCADIGGHLMSSRLPTIDNMIQHSTYWLGFSRIMIINKMDALDLVTNNICCAVARREGDFVLIEGDDCSAKHAFICQDESPERSLASPQSTYPGEQSKSEHTDEKIVYGVVAVSAMLLVAFVITALVCIFRRQLSQERATHSGTQSKREPNQFMGKQISRLPSKPSRKTHPKKETTESSYENVSFVRGQQDDAMHQLGYSNFEYENIVFDNAHVQ
ncbi:hypothetical protein ACJMK2_022710 [Sinanodonta woodiana]|uniref:WSC domain-containing protein n=1 Tax=Sinanodonta woodiana TaxID=1069815 RepID=A0ABD3TL66_SINWO